MCLNALCDSTSIPSSSTGLKRSERQSSTPVAVSTFPPSVMHLLDHPNYVFLSKWQQSFLTLRPKATCFMLALCSKKRLTYIALILKALPFIPMLPFMTGFLIITPSPASISKSFQIFTPQYFLPPYSTQIVSKSSSSAFHCHFVTFPCVFVWIFSIIW